MGARAFAENALRFPAVHDLCSCKTGQNRVSRTVRKQLCFIFGLFARENVGADDGAKAFAVHFNAGHALVEADILVIAAIVKGKPLAVVLIVRRVKNGRMTRNRCNLLYHIAKVFIRRKMNSAAHAHANLRAVAAAKHTAVVDEQRVHAAAERRQSRADAGHTAANHDKVIHGVAFVNRISAEPRADHVRRVRFFRAVGKINRVASAVKAG